MFLLVIIGLAGTEMAQAVPVPVPCPASLKLTSNNPVCVVIPTDKSLCAACDDQEKAGDNELHTHRPAP